jgi:hypothetical protein
MIEVNFLAILACGVASLALGFLWYGPLFGKAWSKLMGWGEMTKEKMKEMQKKAMPGYAVSFIGSLVMAYVLLHSLTYANAYFGTSGIENGLMAGFWNWLGFVVPITIGTVLWEGKSMKLWYINAGYYLAQLLLMGTILSLWQ